MALAPLDLLLNISLRFHASNNNNNLILIDEKKDYACILHNVLTRFNLLVPIFQKISWELYMSSTPLF